MATVDKTWVFLADLEGLADVGDSSLGIANDAAGNPGGSLEFTEAGTYTATHGERARRASTGETWQTWGVPAGATVTNVQIISFDYRPWTVSSVTSWTVKARILDSAAASVHSAGDLLNQSLTLSTGAWLSAGAGTSRAVDAGKQASTTDVRMEIEAIIVNAGGSADVGTDNFLLRMTYTPAASGVSRPVVTRLQAVNRGASI